MLAQQFKNKLDYKSTEFEEENVDDYKFNIESEQPMTEENQKIFQQFLNNQERLSCSQFRNAKSIKNINELDPLVLQYMIVNQDTGEVIDGRNNELVAQLIQNNVSLDNKSNIAWKDFWNNVKKLNEDLITSSELGDMQKIVDLLENQSQYYPIDINTKVLDNWTAMHYSAMNDNYQIAQYLIEKGANFESETTFLRRPIHVAVFSRSLAVLQVLIQNKADINCQDKDFCTPLYYAAELNFKEIVEFLLQNGALGNLQNFQNTYPYEATTLPEIKEIFLKYNQIPQSPGPGYYIYGNSRAKMIEKLLFLTQQKQYINDKNYIQKADQVNKLSASDFTFYKKLGQGAFGEVYLVKKDNQEFAMKILYKQKIFGKHLERYAATEKNILSSMNHPFIVKLRYSFQNQDKLFLVMDYCHGGDFSSILREKTKFPEKLAKIYIAELILALEALHKKLIIFRDLKPDNMLQDKDGHLLLVDFGLAKQTIDYDQLNQSYLGTPIYFAPEIIKKSGHTRQVDWYQLGVIMYEFLVGMPPYFDYEREILFQKIMSAPLRLPKSMSDQAKDLIKRFLHRDYKKRIGSTRDADEIKEHPWFSDINWSDIYNRKVQVPKPQIKVLPTVPIQVLFLQNNEEENQKTGQFFEWEYIDPSKLQ